MSSDLGSSFSVGYLQAQMMTQDDILASASVRVQQNAQRATLVFLCCSVYCDMYKRSLRVQHSLGDGVFCVDSKREPITEEMAAAIGKELKDLLSKHDALEEVRIPRNELFAMFKRMGRMDKVGVLKALSDNPVPCVRCGRFVDYVLEPMQLDLRKISSYEIKVWQEGFVLRLPTLMSPNRIGEWIEPHAQHEMFLEYGQWAELVGVENVAQLNELIYKRQVYDIKWVCEGLHQRKLAKIAQTLVSGFPERRIVTIAGPSSSNKTTFAKRLGIALRVCGFESLVIEMDDFFVNREDTPLGPDGHRDFEAITALNVELLSERVHALLRGEVVQRRKYDFKSGMGIDTSEQQKLTQRSFLILEGIHGLNPELLMCLGRDEVTPIYVSPLTPLSIDDEHRFPTTDLRLIRRIIRDHKYRGFSARKTIKMWTSVRVGEEKNIFPYQSNAELFFNSSLVYELPVLSIPARGLLAEATVPEDGEDPKDPMCREITREARRLLGLVNLFYAIPLEEVPHISCIREFVGGSDLKY